MKLIVGLGNPGSNYTLTRHNIGFLAIDYCIKAFSASKQSAKFNSEWATAMIANEKCLFMKPQTYMNNSGEAIQKCMAFYKIPLEDVVVIVDDFELPFGTARIRDKGSAGTHNGLKSIIQLCSGQQFSRIRLGVGPINPFYSVKDFVLSPFPATEQHRFDELFKHCAAIVELLVKGQLNEAMNRYNNKPLIALS